MNAAPRLASIICLPNWSSDSRTTVSDSRHAGRRARRRGSKTTWSRWTIPSVRSGSATCSIWSCTIVASGQMADAGRIPRTISGV